MLNCRLFRRRAAVQAALLSLVSLRQLRSRFQYGLSRNPDRLTKAAIRRDVPVVNAREPMFSAKAPGGPCAPHEQCEPSPIEASMAFCRRRRRRSDVLHIIQIRHLSPDQRLAAARYRVAQCGPATLIPWKEAGTFRLCCLAALLDGPPTGGGDGRRKR